MSWMLPENVKDPYMLAAKRSCILIALAHALGTLESPLEEFSVSGA
jgi:hypothetical protein